jgi:hypothetical protein
MTIAALLWPVAFWAWRRFQPAAPAPVGAPR